MSHIYFVRDGLKTEIKSREEQLEALYPNNPYTTEFMDDVERTERRVTIEFLTRWIRENKALLSHIEKCCKEDSDASWITNPDRMGGAYTEDEINNTGWK